MHQLWQAVILKPLKLGECILHFWKPPIFINLVPTDQGHSCILSTKKFILKISCFITVSLLGVYILFSMTVSDQEVIQTSNDVNFVLKLQYSNTKSWSFESSVFQHKITKFWIFSIPTQNHKVLNLQFWIPAWVKFSCTNFRKNTMIVNKTWPEI